MLGIMGVKISKAEFGKFVDRALIIDIDQHAAKVEEDISYSGQVDGFGVMVVLLMIADKPNQMVHCLYDPFGVD